MTGSLVGLEGDSYGLIEHTVGFGGVNPHWFLEKGVWGVNPNWFLEKGVWGVNPNWFLKKGVNPNWFLKKGLKRIQMFRIR